MEKLKIKIEKSSTLEETICQNKFQTYKIS